MSTEYHQLILETQAAKAAKREHVLKLIATALDANGSFYITQVAGLWEFAQGNCWQSRDQAIPYIRRIVEELVASGQLQWEDRVAKKPEVWRRRYYWRAGQ